MALPYKLAPFFRIPPRQSEELIGARKNQYSRDVCLNFEFSPVGEVSCCRCCCCCLDLLRLTTPAVAAAAAAAVLLLLLLLLAEEDAEGLLEGGVEESPEKKNANTFV